MSAPSIDAGGGLGTCIAGIGGFGQAHHGALTTLEGEGRLRLLATCDPRYPHLPKEIARHRLHERQVEVHASFEEMLDRHAERTRLVTLATPISFHATMHRECVRRNLACYLEKPPTLDPVELEAMIAVDAKAAFRTQVGFGYIVESWRHELKERLWSGEFGRIHQASFLGLWRRPNSYYTRSPWAGRLSMDGALILDSCFGNAMSHHVHNLLFFAGSEDVFSWADVEQVTAELYRANPIESADTVVTEATTSTGIVLRVAMSHACSRQSHSLERIITEKAVIEITPNQAVEIRHHSGKIERWSITARPVSDHMRYYVNYLEGKVPRPLTTLVDSRPLVTWNALIFVAAGHIQDVPEHHRMTEKTHAMESSAIIIRDIERILGNFIQDGVPPSAAGVPWAAPGGRAAKDGTASLRTTVDELVRRLPVPPASFSALAAA